MKIPVHDGSGPVTMPAAKDPDAVKDWRIAWGDWLREGETITDSTWISDGVFTISNTDSIASEVIGQYLFESVEIVWLSGGTPGEKGLITNRITTNQGRTEDRSFWLVCNQQ